MELWPYLKLAGAHVAPFGVTNRRLRHCTLPIHMLYVRTFTCIVIPYHQARIKVNIPYIDPVGYTYIYTYSQENSWKNQLTKSSSIKRGHYLTYLANPNNGLFVWGKPFKITIHLCSVWSTSKQVLSKDPCQKASTSWKTTAQTSRFPNAKKVVLGFACSMLKKRFQKYSPKGWFDGDEYHGRISDKITNLTNPSDTHQLF